MGDREMMYHAVIRDVAETLVRVLPTTTVAAILDATLSAEADERLGEDQVDLATRLHEALATHRPDAVAVAVTGRGDADAGSRT